MQIPKPTDADKEFFRSVLPDDPEIEIKPMFGNLGAFVHGNMFAGLFGADVGVRLDDGGRAELAATDGSGPFGPGERPMGGYLSLPAGLARHARGHRRLGRARPRLRGHAAAQAEEAGAGRSGIRGPSWPGLRCRRRAACAAG